MHADINVALAGVLKASMAVLKLDAVAVAELARRHRDQRDAGPNKSKHRDSEHMDATSRCPAVASSKPPVAPVGVDSTIYPVKRLPNRLRCIGLAHSDLTMCTLYGTVLKVWSESCQVYILSAPPVPTYTS